MPSKNKNVKLVKAPDGQPLELVRWYLAPIWIPTMLKEEIDAKCEKLNIPISEFVLGVALAGLEYDETTIAVTRSLCFPGHRRTDEGADDDTES